MARCPTEGFRFYMFGTLALLSLVGKPIECGQCCIMKANNSLFTGMPTIVCIDIWPS